MTKRTAEDLVAEWERSGVATVNLDELKALIASWREQGEALRLIARQTEPRPDMPDVAVGICSAINRIAIVAAGHAPVRPKAHDDIEWSP